MIYKRYATGGVPSEQEYRTFQDYIFRYLVREGGRLHLPIHIHSAVGIGDYFSISEGNVMNLENILRDPRYADTVFVLIHGGYSNTSASGIHNAPVPHGAVGLTRVLHQIAGRDAAPVAQPTHIGHLPVEVHRQDAPVRAGHRRVSSGRIEVVVVQRRRPRPASRRPGSPPRKWR